MPKPMLEERTPGQLSATSDTAAAPAASAAVPLERRRLAARLPPQRRLQLSQDAEQKLDVAARQIQGALPGRAGVQQVRQTAADRYVVLAQGNNTDEPGLVEIIGEYVEKGRNHGRKVYQKISETGNGFHEVFMYFWDSRDGPDLHGWWFGNSLGGTQVWSYCKNFGDLPPTTGWQIPWDGPVCTSLSIASKADQQRSKWLAMLEAVKTEVENEVSQGLSALNKAKSLAGDYSQEKTLDDAHETLKKVAGVLSNAEAKLAKMQERAASSSDASQHGTAAELSLAASQLVSRFHRLKDSVNSEVSRVKSAKAKLEKDREAADRERAVCMAFLPEAIQLTNDAEDSVEKAIVTSELMQGGSDDAAQVEHSVDQTEKGALEAQTAMKKARTFLISKAVAARRFECEQVRSEATSELGHLQNQLQDMQERLSPLLAVRKQHEQRKAAKAMISEVRSRLALAELKVDKAEEITGRLSGEGLNEESLQQTEEAFGNASQQVADVSRFLELQRQTDAQFVIADELSKMEARCNASSERLAKLKNFQKEASEHFAVQKLLKEAREKGKAVQDAVQKAADAEAPFLMGVEELPADWTVSALKACETAAMAANTAMTIARMFIATKLVEVRRFSAGPSAEAQKLLKECQDDLEVYVDKLNTLKEAAAHRKRKTFLRDSESQVTKAEGFVKQLSEKASIFEDDAQLPGLTPNELRKVQEEVLQEEKAAQAAVEEARKFITGKQIESKNQDAFAEVGAVLIRQQTRLSNAEATINKCKQLTASVDARRASKQVIGDADSKVQAMEEKVSKAKTLVARLSELTSGSEKEIKEADASVAEGHKLAKALNEFLLETHSRYQDYASAELEKLLSRAKQAQDCMNAAAATMRERGERLLVNALLQEVQEKMKETEKSINEACNAEAALLTGSEELSVEAASAATANLAKSTQAANSMVSSAKTLLAMKRLNAKRFSTAEADRVEEALTKAQAKLETMAKDLTAIRSGVIERQQVQTHMEVAAALADVEQKLQAATCATAELTKLADDSDPKSDTMKVCYDKARKAHAEVASALNSTKSLLAEQTSKLAGAVDKSPAADLSNLSQKVHLLQEEFDKQKKKLVLSEHKFVARRLQRDVQALVEGFEKKLSAMMKSVSPLLAESWQDFMASNFLEHCIDALRTHMQNAHLTVERLLPAMGAVDGNIMEAEFVSFLVALPELQKQHQDFVFSEEDVRAAFRCLDQKASGQVSVPALQSKLKARYVCSAAITMTDSLTLKDSKTIRKLEVNEALEALEAPSTDAELGLLRVKARTERDRKEGFVTLTGSQGTVYLTPCSAVGTSQKKLEIQLQELSNEVTKAKKHLETKAEGLKAVPSGPLAEARGDILKTLLPRLLQVHTKLFEKKTNFAETQTQQSRWKEIENKRRQELREQQAALVFIDKLAEEANKLLADVDEVLLSTETLTKSVPGDVEGWPPQALELALVDVQTRLKSIDEVQESIKAQLEGLNVKPSAEARSVLMKLKVRLASSNTKCKQRASALEVAKRRLCQDAYEELRQVLQVHAQQNAITPDSFFKAISLGDDISVGAFKAYVAGLPDLNLKAERLDLACKHFHGESISKFRAADLLQEYFRCVHEIGITTSIEVRSAKTIRKLLPGEIVEVLESSRLADESALLQRSRCRALTDSAQGWISTKGTHGTDFLVRTGKPYFLCQVETACQIGSDRGSSKVEGLLPGEVIELLEGPRQEPAAEMLRVRVKTYKDRISGWVTLRDSLGDSDLQLRTQFICKASIAITNNVDIDAKDSFLRKLEVDETLDLLEETREVSSQGIRRARMRASSDSLEGWVTLTGNHGTAYVVESEDCYACARSCQLDVRMALAGNPLRMLEEGELVKVLEGPKILMQEEMPRARGRSLRTGFEGWFDLSGAEMVPWAVWQSCLKSTPLMDRLDGTSAKTLRMVEPKERLEALEIPVTEGSGGAMTIRVRAEKDGIDGYVKVSDEKGNIFFEPICL